MRMTEEEYRKAQSRVKAPARADAKVVAKAPAKATKYGNRKTIADGIKFDSKKEAARYRVLKEDEDAGFIRNLVIQPVFVLAPPVTLYGRLKPSLRYYADFGYEASVASGDWVKIVEDVKSAATKTSALYRVKLHLLKYVHGIDVNEV